MKPTACSLHVEQVVLLQESHRTSWPPCNVAGGVCRADPLTPFPHPICPLGFFSQFSWQVTLWPLVAHENLRSLYLWGPLQMAFPVPRAKTKATVKPGEKVYRGLLFSQV